MSTKQSSPYGEADYSGFFQNLKMPGADVGFDTILKNHKKNMETFSTAQQTASDVFRGFVHLNTQYWKSIFEDASANSRNMMNGPHDPGEKMQQHAETLKGCADKAWNHSQQMGEMLNQSTTKIADIYAKRFNECMDEGKGFLKNGHAETIKV